MDGIERDLEDSATVVRLDLMSRVGREIAARYGVRSIPTLLVLDDGHEVYRQDGMPDRAEIVRRTNAL